MQKVLHILLILLLFAACDRERPQFVGESEGRGVDIGQFQATHHYWTNFNFLTTDTVVLHPVVYGDYASIFDSEDKTLGADMGIVVADVAIIPADTIDSVWVRVAADSELNGWVHESDLLERTVPDNNVSRFIYEFSDHRVHVMFGVLAVAFFVFCFAYYRHSQRYFIHFRDVPSFYPTLLTIVVSTSAALYGSLQRFYPDVWEEYYFHPTINPLGHAPMLLAFLLSVWFIAVILIAVIDDLRKQRNIIGETSYFATLMGLCMILYFVFTQIVDYNFGYVLLTAYHVFAIRQHWVHSRARYRCGRCGTAMRAVGKCPHCGAINY